MFECKCGKQYSYKHSLLHHSRFLCALLTSPVLTTTRRSEQETAPQTDCEVEIDDGVSVVEEGAGGNGDNGRDVFGEGQGRVSEHVEVGVTASVEDSEGLVATDKTFQCFICERSFRSAKARKNHRAKKKCQVFPIYSLLVSFLVQLFIRKLCQ